MAAICKRISFCILVILFFCVTVHAEERVFVVNSYVHGTNPLWSTVAMLNGKNLAILGTLQIYNDPAFIAASPDGTRLWVPCKNSEYIVVIDALTFEKIRTIDLGDIILQRPFGLSFTPDGNFVYVTYTNTGEVGVFNAVTTAEIMPPITLPPVTAGIDPRPEPLPGGQHGSGGQPGLPARVARVRHRLWLQAPGPELATQCGLLRAGS